MSRFSRPEGRLVGWLLWAPRALWRCVARGSVSVNWATETTSIIVRRPANEFGMDRIPRSTGGHFFSGPSHHDDGVVGQAADSEGQTTIEILEPGPRSGHNARLTLTSWSAGRGSESHTALQVHAVSRMPRDTGDRVRPVCTSLRANSIRSPATKQSSLWHLCGRCWVDCVAQFESEASTPLAPTIRTKRTGSV